MWVRNVFGDVLYDRGVARQPDEVFQPLDEGQAMYFVKTGAYVEVESPRQAHEISESLSSPVEPPLHRRSRDLEEDI